VRTDNRIKREHFQGRFAAGLICSADAGRPRKTDHPCTGRAFRAALDTEDEPSTPRADVRLALAVLIIFSRARERRPYDEFWHILQDPYPNEYSEMMRGVRRHQEIHTCFEDIARDQGVPRYDDYRAKLSDLVIGPDRHRWRPGRAFGRADDASAKPDTPDG
jgi:hypothetical protein